MTLPYRVQIVAIDGFLTNFASLVPLLAPTAHALEWTIEFVDGMLLSGGSIHLDDAERFAESTKQRRISWEALCEFLNLYFQIYDCECTGTSGATEMHEDSPPQLWFECFDATSWTIATRDPELLVRARNRPDAKVLTDWEPAGGSDRGDRKRGESGEALNGR